LDLAGGVLTVVGATAGIVSAFAYQGDRNPPNRVAAMQDGADAVTDGLVMGLGLLLWVEDGPIASALHAYESDSGHRVLESGMRDVGLRLAPAPGGGVLGLGGRF
jgi:hypothetical protein